MGNETHFNDSEYKYPYSFVYDVECEIPSVFEKMKIYFRKHVAITATYAEKDTFSADLCVFLKK
jgi:hypothetical protein